MLKELKFLIKVIPFYVASLYMLYMGVCLLGLSEKSFLICDLIVYSGPTYAISLILLSIKSGFCKWHRIAIIIPLLAAMTGYIDSYVIKFSVFMENVNVVSLCLFSALTIFSGIKVLWKKE